MQELFNNLTPEEKVRAVTSRLRGGDWDGQTVFFRDEGFGSYNRTSATVKWALELIGELTLCFRTKDLNQGIMTGWFLVTVKNKVYCISEILREPKETLITIKLVNSV